MVEISSLFQLCPVDSSGLADVHLNFDSLPTIEPRFSLPLLDEDAAGSERLLESLNGVKRLGPFDDVQVGSPTRKGKEKEVLLPASDNSQECEQENVWESAAGPSRKTFQPLKTWDALNIPSPFSTTTGLISEASSSVFDALVTSLEPEIHLSNVRSKVPPAPLDSDLLLRLMMRSSLGTVTTDELVWDRRNSRFKWSDRTVRVERWSASTSASIMEEFLTVGTAIRRLELMLDTHSTEPLTPTHHTMLHTVSTYLTYIKTHLATAIDQKQDGWQQSSESLRDVRELCLLLCEIMCWPIEAPQAEGLPSRASSLLTHIYSFLNAHLSTSSFARSPSILASAYILSQTSGPFFALLHGWLGLRSAPADEDIDPESQPWSDLGITRSSLPVSESGELRWSYGFTGKRMPGFIPKELRRVLFEAGKSLRLLREASNGQHPLCGTEWGLEVGWGWGQSTGSSSTPTVRLHVRRVDKEIEHWRRSVRDRSRRLSLSKSSTTFGLRPPRKDRKKLPLEFTQQQSSAVAAGSDEQPKDRLLDDQEHLIDELWSKFDALPGAHLAKSTDTQLWGPTPLSALQSFIEHHCDPSHPLLPPDSPSLQLFISSHLLAPLLAHAKLVSTSLVSLYLDDLHLLDHYDILKAYFLAGDVGFSERVSGALFGKDEAGAGEALGLGRRARTRVRLGLGGDEEERGGGEEDSEWGIGLGLGLSERARWPPGGSELAYALRTSLVGENEEVKYKSAVWEEVEERMSFAVKNVPESEEGQRARWMNPQAIEALDFLYLSYSPPPFLTQLLPTALMVKYQSIHNLLLRIARVKTVLRSLYIDTTHPTPLFDEPVKEGVDMGSRPASCASRGSRGAGGPAPAPVVQSIFVHRSKVEYTLHRLRFRMSGSLAALEEYFLDIAIGVNWSTMRRRLDRLRRTQTEGPVTATAAGTPTSDLDDYFESSSPSPGDSDEEDDDRHEVAESSETIVQLQSIHSLLAYHHLILDRILRSMLLSPSAGHQVTLKILNGLFGLILDVGKQVKLVERGMVGWEDGADTIEQYSKEWTEREAVFLHALERLSLRTNKDKREKGDHNEHDLATGDERDLEILLSGEKDGEDNQDGAGRDSNTNGGQLGELLLRLNFGNTGKAREGRWKGPTE